MHSDSGPQRLLQCVDVPISETLSLRVSQDKGQGSATGWLVWPVAKDLAKFLLDNVPLVDGKTILEVGAGTGLVGLVCASAGAQSVVISDLADGLKMCHTNVVANRQVVPASCKVYVEELLWGSEKHLLHILEKVGPIHLIVGSDVVYHQSNEILGALAGTIIAASNRDTTVLIAYEDREGLIDDELYFFSPMRDRFRNLDLVDLGKSRIIYRFSGFIE